VSPLRPLHRQDIALKRYDIAPNTHGLAIGRLRKGCAGEQEVASITPAAYELASDSSIEVRWG